MNNLQKRILTSIVYVVVLVGSIMLGEITSILFFSIVIVLSQLEFYRFFDKGEVSTQKILGIIGSLILFGTSAANKLIAWNHYWIFVLIPFLFLFFILELYRSKSQPIQNIAYSLLGIIYIAVPFTLLYQSAYFDGTYFSTDFHYEILLAYFFVLWANDTGAYFVGTKFGKTPFFPSISPKKTWEGFIGGLFLGLVVGYVNSILFTQLNLITSLTLSIVIVLFGTLGDLVESMFKRSLNIKDSGTLLPGHGGFLDRFDGILISAPFVYFFLFLLSHI